jgi:hypothetical protein
MRQTTYFRESYQRILATAGFVVVLATTACGVPAAGAVQSSPTPGPVTVDSIAAAFGNSLMDNGHFKMHGTFIRNRVYYPVTGDGVLQMRPQQALEMNLSIQTFSSQGILKIQEIAIGTRLYIRIGKGKWGQRRESASPTAPSTYLGEQIISGVAYWHTRSSSGSSSFELWIRETDGYPFQLQYASTSGTLIMNFNSYNKSPVIVAPKA